MDRELSYLRRRVEEELKAAGEAADPNARKAHERLAAEYELRLKAACTVASPVSPA